MVINMDKKTLWRIGGLIAFAAAALGVVLNLEETIVGIRWFLSLFNPLLVGGILAFTLNIPLTKLESILFPKAKKAVLQKLRRPLAIILSFAVVIAVLTVFINIVVPETVKAVSVFIRSLPNFMEGVKDLLAKYSSQLPVLQKWVQKLDLEWAQLAQKAFSALQQGVTGLVGSTFSVISSTVSAVISVIIGIIFSVYVLANKEKLSRQLKRLMHVYLKEKTEKNITHVAGICYDIFRSFIGGQCIEAFILGSLCFLGMMILRLPYATMIGATVGITALIPVVGAFIGITFGALMILMLDPMKSLIFLIFIIILQQIEGNVIYPKVVGASVGLPGIWVLAAVTVGGGVGGIIGILLAVPTTSVIYVLVKEAVERRDPAKTEENES